MCKNKSQPGRPLVVALKYTWEVNVVNPSQGIATTNFQKQISVEVHINVHARKLVHATIDCL